MKALEFNELTGQQLAKLDTAQLSKLVSAQAKTANKRYTRIKNDKTSSKDAVKRVEKSGGRFGAKGKTKQQLIKEAKRIQRFNKAKTGTIKGARAVTAERQRQVTGKTATEKAKEAKEEAKEEINRERKKAGKSAKLTKKEKAKVEAAGNRAKRKVEKETKQKVKEFEDARKKKQKKKRGKYYYAESDGKGAGVTGDETESDSSPKENFDAQQQEKLFQKEDAYQKAKKQKSPLELVKDKPDKDFVVASDVPFK